MAFRKTFRKKIPLLGVLTLLVISCMKLPDTISVQETAAKAQQKALELKDKTTIKLADGVQLSLWATDSLAPDPVAMDVDHLGREKRPSAVTAGQPFVGVELAIDQQGGAVAHRARHEHG